MERFSAWFVENWPAATVLSLFVVVMALSAWWANRARRSRPGPWVIAISFYATFLSTNTFLGQAGFGYKVGLAWLLGGMVFVVCGIIAWFVVARPMIHDARDVMGHDLDLDQITVPRYLRQKYASPAVGFLSAWIIFFASILYMTAVFKGVGHIFARILNLSYEVAVVSVFVFVVAYTSWGMIRAILHTDAVQGGAMLLGAVALFVATCAKTDWSRVVNSPDLTSQGEIIGPALMQWDSLMSPLLIFGLSLGTGIKLMIEPRMVVRFLLFRHASERDIRRAKWLAVVLMTLTIPMLFHLGILAHGIIPQEQSQHYFNETDEVVPFLVKQLFGPVWGAVILGSFLCAALSSIDSVLHVAGSALVVDVWAERRPEAAPETVDRWQRAIMLPVAALPAIIALDPPADVVPLTALSGALFGGCFFPALILGLWFRRAGPRAVLASILAGGGAVVLWSLGLRELLGLSAIHPILAGLTTSVTVFFASQTARRRGKAQHNAPYSDARGSGL